MLQVGLVDDEKVFKVNDGDDDNDINNDFHFDVNVDDDGDHDDGYDDSIRGYDLSSYFKPARTLLRVTMLGGDKYLCETAYNPFTLLRLGNMMDKRSWLVNIPSLRFQFCSGPGLTSFRRV
jgi:hypothetical protein